MAVSATDMLSDDLERNIEATIAFVKACTAQPLPQKDLLRTVAFNMLCPPEVRAICRTRPGDYRAAMAKVTCPTMIMWGDQERLAHRSMFDQAMQTIPGAIPKVYPGIGHMPFVEAADVFDADIRAFADATIRHDEVYPK